ncbi:hypothetical protein Pve01_28230 [Planomonospora venezuelensis]|uniref:Uncharacterized protein n=1 Tax=Planomonospora venezuelensis TaxID=1999 RepID=A0A841CUB8_PLAVE|nr:hypothetical protein [Planomonospora venezuelensis]GIN01165.1 hypothetical protein Pve01_28230 [Planomonospora venezuelensis]
MRRTEPLSTPDRARHPLYKSRHTLHIGADLLTDKQKTRLEELFFANEDHL